MEVLSLSFLAISLMIAWVYDRVGVAQFRGPLLAAINLAFFLVLTNPAGRLPTGIADAAWGKAVLFGLVPYASYLVLGFVLVRTSSWRTGLTLPVGLLVLLFCWLKQYTFLPGSLFMHLSYATLGLSYVFFRLLHLLIEAHAEPDLRRISAIGYVNYLLDFTSLVSGPIQLYEDYRQTAIDEPLPLRAADMGRAFERSVKGLFKALVLAGLVAKLREGLLDTFTNGVGPVQSVLLVAALMASYPVYLYLNFSGYTDLVIGVACFFRRTLPENFNRPFSATSFIDYWNRWHMSLSGWLKLHVFHPLMLQIGRRVARPALLPRFATAALFVTFFLIGVWHGRTMAFVVFGLLNGGGVAVNQTYRLWLGNHLDRPTRAALDKHPLYRSFSRGLTYCWVSFTLMWFWCDIGQLRGFYAALGATGCVGVVLVVLIASIPLLHMVVAAGDAVRRKPVNMASSRYVRTVMVTLLVMLVIVNSAATGAAPDIIYEKF